MDLLNEFKSTGITTTCTITKYTHHTESTYIKEDEVVIEHPIALYLYSALPSTRELQKLITNHSVEFVIQHMANSLCKKIQLCCSPEELDSLIIGHLLSEGYIPNIESIHTLYIDPMGTSAFIHAKFNTYSSDVAVITNDTNSINSLDIQHKIDYDALFAQVQDTLNNCELFIKTGALHTSSLWEHGCLKYVMSDIRRHNTIDKLIGKASIDGHSFSHMTLYTSGRIPLDMPAKAARVGIPIIASRSAPTDRSITFAHKHRLTLLGFARNGTLNIYNNGDSMSQPN